MSNSLNVAKKKPVAPSVAVDDSVPATPSNETVLKESIQLLAYQKWEAAGKPCCDGSTFWDQAEKELMKKQ